MVNYTVDVLTALIGLIAVAGVLSVLHIALLPLLILTVLPDGWAAVRAARIRYAKLREMTTIRRRETIIGDLLADRASAAELRAYDMRPFLLDHYKACADHVRDALLGVARRQTLVRAGGDSASGAATALTYTALGGLLVGGAMPLSVAGTAVLAIRQGQTSLNQLLLSVNACYESGLFFNDFLEFCDQARTRLAPPATRPLPGELEVLSTAAWCSPTPGRTNRPCAGWTSRSAEVRWSRSSVRTGRGRARWRGCCPGSTRLRPERCCGTASTWRRSCPRSTGPASGSSARTTPSGRCRRGATSPWSGTPTSSGCGGR